MIIMFINAIDEGIQIVKSCCGKKIYVVIYFVYILYFKNIIIYIK